MTSCFHLTEQNENDTRFTSSPGAAPGTKFAVSDRVLFHLKDNALPSLHGGYDNQLIVGPIALLLRSKN